MAKYGRKNQYIDYANKNFGDFWKFLSNIVLTFCKPKKKKKEEK